MLKCVQCVSANLKILLQPLENTQKRMCGCVRGKEYEECHLEDYSSYHRYPVLPFGVSFLHSPRWFAMHVVYGCVRARVCMNVYVILDARPPVARCLLGFMDV